MRYKARMRLWVSISIGLVSAATSGPAMAERPFCDGLRACDVTADKEQEKVRAAWQSPYTSDAQRDMIKSLVGSQPNVDWAAVSQHYFAWREQANRELILQQHWKAAKQAVSTMLIDPDSAKFKPISGFGSGSWNQFWGNVSGSLICISVNAKNRLGGYTGAQTYAVVVDNLSSIRKIDWNYGKYDHHVDKVCAQADLPSINFTLNEEDDAKPSASIGAELAKIIELKQQGMLSDAEFTAAKNKVLGLR